jgi:hypothetical protein
LNLPSNFIAQQKAKLSGKVQDGLEIPVPDASVSISGIRFETAIKNDFSGYGFCLKGCCQNRTYVLNHGAMGLIDENSIENLLRVESKCCKIQK